MAYLPPFLARWSSWSGDALSLQHKTTALLDRLTPTHREVLRLVDLEKKSVGEVAVILGRSERATRDLLYRARRRFDDVFNFAGSPDDER